MNPLQTNCSKKFVILKSSVIFADQIITLGAWRSWLAYLHGVQGVGSSSLLAPTELREMDPPFFYGLFLEKYCPANGSGSRYKMHGARYKGRVTSMSKKKSLE